MNNFWLACKFWLLCCVIAAIWAPTERDPSSNSFTAFLGDTAFYVGRSLRVVYDFVGSYF